MTAPVISAPAMPREIEVWPLDRLRPYSRNARTHSPEQVDQIAASIVEFGFVNPILVDAAGGIIAGHGSEHRLHRGPVDHRRHQLGRARRSFTRLTARPALPGQPSRTVVWHGAVA